MFTHRCVTQRINRRHPETEKPVKQNDMGRQVYRLLGIESAANRNACKLYIMLTKHVSGILRLEMELNRSFNIYRR